MVSPTPQELVSLFLRAQNLEQVRRVEEAVALYEEVVAAGFDSAGPYDRLISIYRAQEDHRQVVRIASAALAVVRTFSDKRSWYESLRDASEDALSRQPDRRGAEF